jgi:hypothetical protein
MPIAFEMTRHVCNIFEIICSKVENPTIEIEKNYSSVKKSV